MPTPTYIGDSGPDGVVIAQAQTSKAAFYGATPVAQRASSLQATSFLSLSSNATVPATLTAFVTEVANTFVGLGIWKGSA